MGRRRKSDGEKQEKKTPTKLRPIAHKWKGKVTEPWTIMERLVAELDIFEELRGCQIRLYWRRDWKADVDGVAVGAQVSLASEDKRLLAEEGGESLDASIKLPEDQWPSLDDTEKEHRIYHELRHIAARKDTNGHQKRDSKDRFLWRMRRHPIACFPDEIERYGYDRVIGHNDRIVQAIEDASRPLIAAAEKAGAERANGETVEESGVISDPPATSATPDPAGWRSAPLADAGIIGHIATKLRRADIDTLGKLSDTMNRYGMQWYLEVPEIGEGSADKISDCFADYWRAHPEYCREPYKGLEVMG